MRSPLTRVLVALCLSYPAIAAENGASLAPIKEALQSRDFNQAVRLAEAVGGGGGDGADEARYLQGVAFQLAGKHAEAIGSADALLAVHPQSKWVDKAHFLKAASLVKLGRFEDAEALYAEQARQLLSTDRKREIARALVAFADALAAAPDPRDPSAPPPDHVKAYNLYKKVLEMEVDRPTRDEASYKAALALQKAENHAQAVEEFYAYLDGFDPDWTGPVGSPRRMRGQKRENPPAAGAYVFDARYRLGESQLALSQFAAARMNFQDLLALLEAAGPADFAGRIADTRWQVVRSHNMPQLDGDLERAVKAARDFLDRHADHPHAVEAAWMIAQTYHRHGRHDEAIAAYRAFIDAKIYKLPPGDLAEKKLERLGKSPAELQDEWRKLALFQIGGIFYAQKKYDAAIEAWASYINQHPTGPQWGDAQRMILDARFMAVLEAVAAGEYDPARGLIEAFVAGNPLDPRNAQLLYILGQVHHAHAERLTGEKVDRENVDAAYELAVAEWEKLVSKHPNTEESSLALYRIGLTYEEQLGDLERALESYRRLTWGSWSTQARRRVAVMTEKQLAVRTERKYRTDEAARVAVKTRNIEKLTVRQYTLDLEAYFRKTHTAGGIEGLDIALIEPDKTWEVTVPGYVKHKPIEQSVDVPFENDRPGVCILQIGDEELEATTLVIRSDVEVVTRSSRRELLVYAQDMRAGRPAGGVRVLASDGEKVFVAGVTGEDGVFRQGFDQPQATGVRVFAERAGHVAATGVDFSGLGVSTGLAPRGLVYTDRPLYQPGQTVFARGVIRGVKDGAYAVSPGAEYLVTVTDPSGRVIREEPATLGEFGTFSVRIPLDPQAPAGEYGIATRLKDKDEVFHGSFRVEAFQLRKMRLAFDFPRTVYFRGEKVTGTIRAEYYWGQPVAEKSVRYRLPDGTTYAEKTDAKGELKVEFDTSGMTPGSLLPFVAELEGEDVRAGQTLSLPLLAFNASVSPSQPLSLAGEPFGVTVQTTTPDGKPHGTQLTLTVLRAETVNPDPVLGAVPWVSLPTRPAAAVTVDEQQVTTDEKTGKAVVRLSLDKGGLYTIRVAGEDRFNQVVTAESTVEVSGDDDATKLRIFAESDTLKVGAESMIRLHSRLAGDALALLTYEGETIIAHRIVPLKPGHNELPLAVDHAHFPNFTLAATVIDGRDLRAASHAFTVERELKVAVRPLKETYGPGAEGAVELTVTDQLGRPVRAELSLAMVHEALYAISPDPTPNILGFFQESARRHAEFRVAGSNGFSYAADTRSVVEAVQDEAQRLARDQENLGVEEQMREELDKDFAFRGDGRSRNNFSGEKAEGKDADGDGVPDFTDGQASDLSGGLPSTRQPPPPKAYSLGKLRGQAADRFYALEPSSELKEAASIEFFSDGHAGLADDRFARSLGESPRRETPGEGFWLASIVTAPDGKATVGVPMPQTTTEWRLTARGVTVETLVGGAAASIVTRKDFFVELKTPRSVVEGDRLRVTARIHNLTDFEGDVELRLTVTSGDKKFNELRQSVRIGKQGTAETLFEEITVPQAATLDVTVEAAAGGLGDALTKAMPVRPWGVEYAAHRGGVSFDDTTAVLELPPDQPYRSKWMTLAIGADVKRQVIQMALDDEGGRAYPQGCVVYGGIPGSDLLAAAAGLGYARAVDAPEADRWLLLDRVRSLVSALVVTQKPDGGWGWGGSDASDWNASAMSYWALGEAEKVGVRVHPPTLIAAETYLRQFLQNAGGSDYDAKAVVLHALSVSGKADYQLVNPLHRQRNALSAAALAYTALTLANLDRKPMSEEVLAVLDTKLSELKLDGRAGNYLAPKTPYPWLNDRVEATAVGLLALMRVTPLSKRIDPMADYLLTTRGAQPWQPAKSRGPAVAALGDYFRAGQFVDADFTLEVSINDRLLTKIAHDGQNPSVEIAVPAHMLKDGPNTVRFHLEGRGGFAWAATLRGFSEQFKDPQTLPTPRVFAHRFYHDQLTYRGAEIGVQSTSEVKALEVGQKSRVWVGIAPVQQRVQPPYLVVEEHLPAGVTLVPGSLRGQFTHHEVRDGSILLYFAPGRPATAFEYEVVGFAAGTYRAAPTTIRDALDPGQVHLGEPGELVVLAPGEKSNDPYVLNDAERFALGGRHFEDGRYKEALGHLVPLFDRQYRYNEREVARMLLWVHTTEEFYDARRVVEAFEALSERYPDLVVPFDRILIAARAYHDIGEFERASLVYRATIASSFLRDSAVSAILQDEGQLLASIDYQEDLWWRYPDSPQVVSSLFALSQLLHENAGRAHELAAQERTLTLRAPGQDAQAEPPKPTRPAMLAEAVRLMQRFLTLYPLDPLADDAAFSTAGAYLDLKDYDAVIRLSDAYGTRFASGEFGGSFRYMAALGHFWKRDYEPALGAARAVAEGGGRDRDFARYILGQVHHAQGNPAEAIRWYESVDELYPDAAQAIGYFREKRIAMQEVHTFMPGEGVELEVKHRNIAQVNLQVYRVDLMKLYLREKNLSRIAAVNLAGIEPQATLTLELGDGMDYVDKARTVSLDAVKDEGAYLVIARGDDLFASTLVLVTPLKLEVQEDPASGRVRVNVVDQGDGLRPAGVHVKAIGSLQSDFRSGETDLRGIFIADDIRGVATVIARDEASRYAFYRGKASLGPPEAIVGAPAVPLTPSQELQRPREVDYNLNLLEQQRGIQLDNFRLWDQLRRSGGQGVEVREAK